MADLFAAGGKRLRPALVLLCGRLGAYDLERLLPAAWAVELMHAATLVHDDVIDRSPTRRGRPTVAASRGEPAAIVVGDYYFARAYLEASRTGVPEVVADLATAVMRICAGELAQQAARYRYRVTREEYMARIEGKTAALTAACCGIGALVGGLPAAERHALQRYGRLLGLAFQIADDVLDYTASADELGKPVGQDLLEGFATLPVMLALGDGGAGDRLDRVLREGRAIGKERALAVVEAVRQTDAPARALAEAAQLADRARAELAMLEGRPGVRELAGLAEYVVRRKL
ncbi:MAG TPA: polyprenyl synthetase family protein [Candidatus Acidoferrales bacterium]|nr:polyprenyl synthetase family protein [Candidatus Acidoferrales bacterium]